MDSVVKRIRQERERQNISQRQLDKKAGLSSGFTSQYESSSHSPKLDKIEAYAKALNVPCWWLAWGEIK